ncbi:MAG: hypothetical protein FWG30_11125 [Eubacteriaceae bacterium]|nr:hypothetical protein [Eubacteriaceae bacterium]
MGLVIERLLLAIKTFTAFLSALKLAFWPKRESKPLAAVYKHKGRLGVSKNPTLSISPKLGAVFDSAYEHKDRHALSPQALALEGIWEIRGWIQSMFQESASITCCIAALHTIQSHLGKTASKLMRGAGLRLYNR